MLFPFYQIGDVYGEEISITEKDCEGREMLSGECRKKLKESIHLQFISP